MSQGVLTAAVVGAGTGGTLSMNALAVSDRYELVAVADISPEARSKASERFSGLRTFASHTEMFADFPTDVVCVSTWATSHREIVQAALSAVKPKGLLCEKPLGDTAAAGKGILDMVQEAAVPLVVPHGLLQLKHSQEIIQRVLSGDIGRLELVEIECDKWDILNAGIHWLNFFVNLVHDDPVEWVMAACEHSTQTFRDGLQVETTGITYAQTASGVRVVMHTGDDVRTMREGKGMLFRLVGTAGLIEFWAWESAYKLENAQFPSGQIVEVARYPESPHQRYLESLAEQIDSGVADYRLPYTSLAALEICEGAYLASRLGTKVTLPLDRFIPPPRLEWDPGQPYAGQGGRDGRKL